MMQPNFQTFIINTKNLFNSLKKYSSDVDSEILVYDVETNSKHEKRALLYGFGVAFTENKGFYIPWRTPTGALVWNDLEQQEIKNWLKEIAASKKLVGHNIIYDILVTEYNLGLDLTDCIYADTILMKHTVNEEPPFALKELCVERFGAWADKAQEKLQNEVVAAGGRWTRDEKDMYLASTETLGEYCCWDVLLTLMLFKDLQDKLDSENLNDLFYKEEVMPLYKEVTINMKRQGFPVDVNYFKNLKSEITNEIITLEDDIMTLIQKDISKFEQDLLDDNYPIKSTGNFPKVAAEYFEIQLPINKKSNKVTLAAKALELQKQEFIKTNSDTNIIDFYTDLISGNLHTNRLVLKHKKDIQKKMFFNDNPDNKYIFNLQSNSHLIELIFNIWGFTPDERTPTGQPKLDDEFLQSLTGNPVIEKLKDYKKLNKLLSTYVEGILDREIDGNIYTSMLQFGTTSGRFASRDPNLNNLPAPKKIKSLSDKYTNSIRSGLVAKAGYKIIGCDFNALEPRVASYVSQDPGLMSIFKNDHDFYSAIGIKQFKITDATPTKDGSANSFPEKYKDLRDKVKTYALAAFYGAQASKISEILGSSHKEAQELLDGYFKAFPNVQNLILKSHHSAKTKGVVATKLGRVRHLREARSLHVLYGDNILDWRYANKNNKLDERRKFKNALNNSVNFQIQGLAAQILNRSMINMTRKFKEQNVDAYIVLSIHDEVLVMCKESDIERASEIIKNSMENTVDLSPVGLKATPIIGNSYGECK